MKANKGKYIRMLLRFGEDQLRVFHLFRRYSGENYAFGFAFQSTSRDFILLAPNHFP